MLGPLFQIELKQDVIMFFTLFTRIFGVQAESHLLVSSILLPLLMNTLDVLGFI